MKNYSNTGSSNNIDITTHLSLQRVLFTKNLNSEILKGSKQATFVETNPYGARFYRRVRKRYEEELKAVLQITPAEIRNVKGNDDPNLQASLLMTVIDSVSWLKYLIRTRTLSPDQIIAFREVVPELAQQDLFGEVSSGADYGDSRKYIFE